MPELEVKITTRAEGTGARDTARELGQVDQAATRVGKSTANAGDAIQQFGRRGSEAKDAFEGLSNVARGGEGAIFGLAKAWRALTIAFAANPVTAAIALVLGLLPLVKKGFDLIGDAAENSTKKLHGAGTRTREAAEGMKALGEASERYIKSATADAEALAKAYGQATSAIDAALRRFKEVEGARLQAETSGLELQRADALAKATTPEQRAKINEQFDTQISTAKARSGASVTNEDFAASSKQLAESLSARATAERAIGQAEAALVNARADEIAAKKSGNVDKFAAALRAREAAEAAVRAVRSKNQPLIDKADTDTADTDARLKVLGYGVKTTANTDALKTFNAAPSAAVQAAQKSYTEAGARGDAIEGTFNARRAAGAGQGELAKLANELDSARGEQRKTYALIAEDTKRRKTEEQKLQRQISNSHSNGPGG